MSLKSVNSRASRWSLTTWLTTWYTLLAFSVITSTTAYSYYVLVSHLDREDEEFLVARLRDVEVRLNSHSTALTELAATWTESSPELTPLRIVMRVLDADGRVLASMQGADDVPWPPFNSKVTLAPTEEIVGWQVATAVTTLNSGEKMFIEAALDRDQESNFLSRYRKQLYLIICMATATCAAGGIVIARLGLRPLKELSSLAATFGAGRMDKRLSSSAYASELKYFATTFNSMLDRLQASFEQINRFSGDIAHEIRTPLNNLRGEVEVALTKSRTDDEYRDVLGSCLEESIRLSRLVDSLLFLARSDQPQASLRRESVRLKNELETIKEFYDVAAEEVGIKLEVASSELQLIVDRTLFQRVIGNLITNSLAHTPRGGHIALIAEARDGYVDIIVKDSGCGIPAEILPKVFDRLFCGNSSRAGLRGHGLGLSIVKSIVELHGGTVSISSHMDLGTTVVTTWPSAEIVQRRSHPQTL